MQVGIQFFPDIGPAVKSARDYWQEALRLLAPVRPLRLQPCPYRRALLPPLWRLQPDPVVFLAAAAQRTSMRAGHRRGAAGFDHPLKLAASWRCWMRCATAGSMSVSRAPSCRTIRPLRRPARREPARFDEGVEQVRLLLAEENVSHDGRLHSFDNVTSLPRPTQRAAAAVLSSRPWRPPNLRVRRRGGLRHDGHPDGGRGDGAS